MDLKTMITEIHETGLSEKKIGDLIGLDQATTHRLRVGTHKSTNFESGLKIVALHKKIVKDKPKN
jgi:hypothetical protein